LSTTATAISRTAQQSSTAITFVRVERISIAAIPPEVSPGAMSQVFLADRPGCSLAPSVGTHMAGSLAATLLADNPALAVITEEGSVAEATTEEGSGEAVSTVAADADSNSR